MGDTRAGSSYTLPCPLPHSNRPTFKLQPVSESRRCGRPAAHLTCPSLSQCWVGPSRGSNPGPGGGRHGRRGRWSGSGAVNSSSRARYTDMNRTKLIYTPTFPLIDTRNSFAVYSQRSGRVYEKYAQDHGFEPCLHFFLNPGIPGMY